MSRLTGRHRSVFAAVSAAITGGSPEDEDLVDVALDCGRGMQPPITRGEIVEMLETPLGEWIAAAETP